jgi:glucokinase
MSRFTIGVDIGGTKIAAGLVENKTGKLIKKIKTLTNRKVFFGIKNLISAVNKIRENKIYPIGIGCAGQIDVKSGRIIYSPNMAQWRNAPLLKILQKKFGKKFKIKVDNDANCFTFAEWKFGAGKGFKNVVGLTLGTGIGSGAVLDGKLYEGRGNAPELGHTTIEVNGRLCRCGKRGHLEIYASGKAIEKQYFVLTKKKLSATEIEKSAEAGDKTTKSVILEAKKYLVLGLANIVMSFDPDIIILGGSIGLKLKMIYAGLQKEVEKNLMFKNKKVIIKKAKLGEDSGLVGAAMLHMKF